MVLRIFGVKKETTYGEAIPSAGVSPDWHKKVSKGDFKLNDEPVTIGFGSRMNQYARPGVAKPTGSVESYMDLKTIGHSLRAFFDQYVFTEGENDDPNVHEFYGAESQDLCSFQGVATFDEFEKRINGLLLDTLKIEASDELVSLAEDWVYKNQIIKQINQATYDLTDAEAYNDAIPLMAYDVSLELDDATPPGVVSSLSLEMKNNLNVDSTVGIGSRFPQAKPQAQKREITPSLTSTLRAATLELIKKAEHGANSDTPTECKVFVLNMKIIFAVCEDPTTTLEMYFPQCLVNVEYESSESDEIETTFSLQALGSGGVTLADGETTVTTDCYCKLVNDVSEIGA